MRRNQRAFVKTARPTRAAQQRLLQAVGSFRRQAYSQARFAPVPAQIRMAGPRRTQPAGEVKGMDTDISLNPVIATTSTNASSFVLNLVQQGAGSWNRVGRKIHSKSLRIVGNLQITSAPTVATGVGSENLIRMVVVWDQQPSGGSIPTFDTIFGITAQDGTESTPDVTCPPRYDNMDRFRVLKDCTYSNRPAFVSSLGSGPASNAVIPIDEYLKLSGQETVFSGQSNPMTIADISTGAIYVYFRTLNNQAFTTGLVDAIARLRYTD